ncbi:PAS domain-containing sensor histidine kinase [Clostridium sp. C8-1-8]|uniref:sensor histidine kinase n=1 Tax=Clostridium sp. C8-1-8 TaxID=2698831 RepID=UPI00136985DB|nr:PAS domain-containing sensor histidine kinase [Clostridium sp. C8-1-8]
MAKNNRVLVDNLKVKCDSDMFPNSLINFMNRYKLYADLLDQVSEGIIIHDSSNIVFANKSLLKLFGMHAVDEIIDKDVFKILETYLTYYREMDEEICRAFHHSTFRTNLIYKGQEVKKVVVRNCNMSFDNREYKVTYIRYYYENENFTVYDEVEPKEVFQSSRGYEPEYLEEGDLSKIRYENYIARLIPILAHELRTPLNILMCSMQMSDVYIEDIATLENNIAKMKHNSIVMKQNCFRLLKLINNIIDSTLLDSKAFILNLKLYDIADIIEDMVFTISDYVRENIKDKKIDIEFFTSVKDKFVYLDLNRFQNAFLKLLSNSFKFNNNGDTIYVCIKESNSKNIEIVVYNKGNIIEEDDLNQLFEKFSAKKSNLAKSHEGIGLGLFIVKNIVELHEWSIEVSNCVENISNQFIIKIPIEGKKIIRADVNNKCNYEILEEELLQKIKIEFSDI